MPTRLDNQGRTLRQVLYETAAPGGGSTAVDSPGTLVVDFLPVNETSPAPAESSAFDIVASVNDPLTSPVETTSFDFGNLVNETANAPALSRTVQLLIAASTVTQTAGTGWTNVANAQGPQDGTVATLNSPQGALPTTVTGTLTAQFTALTALPTRDVQDNTSIKARVRFSFSTALLGALSYTIEVSNNSGANWTQLATASGGSFAMSDDDRGCADNFLTWDNIASFRIRFIGSVTGSATGASTISIDNFGLILSTVAASG